MNETKLNRLFTIVKQGAYEFKTKHPDGDGKAFWQPMKQLFGNQNIRASAWQKLDSNLVAMLMNLSEFDEDGGFITINHFLRQQVRIPTEEEPNLRRIMQVALNCGQYLADKAQDEFDDSLKLLDFDYPRSGLDSLKTYILEYDIEQMSVQISDSLIREIERYLS